MDNSNFCCLVACVCVLFGDRDYRKMIFSRESTYIYIWAVAGHEVRILSIRVQSFNSYLISKLFTNFVNIR